MTKNFWASLALVGGGVLLFLIGIFIGKNI